MQITRAGAIWRYLLNHSVLLTGPLTQTVSHPELRADPPGALLKITSLLSTVFHTLPVPNSTEILQSIPFMKRLMAT
jgi:hypothetical protein